MAENELLTHQDYIRKNEIDGIENKSDSDIYEYPSLVVLGESDEWHENIMGESENTLDLGGQHSPNVVALKQLIGRGNHNKHRIDMLEKQGGIKNLWVDGAMQIWDDGISGDISATNQPRYGYGIQIMRHHSVDINGQTIGTGGSTYHWERVVENDRTWLKMTHVGSVQSGYIGQRWERDTLQFLKGKTVTLSFDYKCGSNMQGTMIFYNEQDILHDGIGTNMGSAVVDYIGDNQVHRASVTVTLSTDNIAPDANAYFGIQLGYGNGGVPNGSVHFSNIQLEVNDKATDFAHVPIAIERLRYGRYYQKSPSWIAGQRIANANRVSLHHDFVPSMKSAPMVNITALAQYNNMAVLLPVTSVGSTNQQSLGTYANVNATLVDSAYIYKFVADARIY